TKVPQAQLLLQVPEIHFLRPALAIPVQYLPRTQRHVRAQEILRALVPRVPPGDQNTDPTAHPFDPPGQLPDRVGRGLVRRRNAHASVARVPKALVVVADADAVQPAVGLDGADRVPALTPDELHQRG